jgi:hypothetical protein
MDQLISCVVAEMISCLLFSHYIFLFSDKITRMNDHRPPVMTSLTAGDQDGRHQKLTVAQIKRKTLADDQKMMAASAVRRQFFSSFFLSEQTLDITNR